MRKIVFILLMLAIATPLTGMQMISGCGKAPAPTPEPTNPNISVINVVNADRIVIVSAYKTKITFKFPEETRGKQTIQISGNTIKFEGHTLRFTSEKMTVDGNYYYTLSPAKSFDVTTKDGKLLIFEH